MTEPAIGPPVLVADDAALAAEAGGCLQRHGFRVVPAPGRNAANRVQPPDAILLDQHLTGIDAVSRIPRLREETGADPGRRRQCRVVDLERGADEFPARPVMGRELLPGFGWRCAASGPRPPGRRSAAGSRTPPRSPCRRRRATRSA